MSTWALNNPFETGLADCLGARTVEHDPATTPNPEPLWYSRRTPRARGPLGSSDGLHFNTQARGEPVPERAAAWKVVS